MTDLIPTPYYMICANLLFWLVATGVSLEASGGASPGWGVVAGLVFAVIWQHRAHYARRRMRR